MKHPNAVLLEKMYSDFKRGDLASMLSACADSITFQIPGKSALAGKYDRASFPSVAAKLMELSDGTYQMDPHDFLASDLHAVVLLTDKFMRGGKPHEYRTVHVWRFQEGKPVAFYEYPRDLYQFDAAWGA